VTLNVSKPDGLVGELVLGPMTRHQRVIFGRAPSCSVVLEHLSVSRQHAALTVDETGAVLVTDLGAAHGTKLGDIWLKAQQERTLPVGTALRFGASTRAYTLLSVRSA
jgi:pSer/pThr/pTyr-binding forkhead associated (FHA) protein